MINVKARAADYSRIRLTISRQWRHHRIAGRAEQRAQRHDGVAANVQPFQNAWERLDSLGAVATRVVQQDNAAVAALLFDAPQNNVGARFRPILRIDAFQNDQIVEVFRDLQRSQFA